MTATKTSLAWQSFRHSNLVTTSTPIQAAHNGTAEESDEAEEDVFVGDDSNVSQDMMIEIMDKYVQAGEALAEKENDVRHLTKQVEELKAVNGNLEARSIQLRKSNEKLADDEGRWYSLARELETQMDVIKKGETYTLFQDKVDEAEARLEVATESSNICKRRLNDLYSAVSTEFRDNGNSGSDEDVDEHRQHADILARLQELTSSSKDLTAALAASRDECTAVELNAQKMKAREADVQRQLEQQVLELRTEATTRDASIQSERSAHQDTVAGQAEELRQALEDATLWRDACTAAESLSKARDTASCKAADEARALEANLESALHDLQIVREEMKKMEEDFAEEHLALGRSQEEVEAGRAAQKVADRNIQEYADQLMKSEGLLEEARYRASHAEDDLQVSVHKFEEMKQTSEAYRGQATAERNAAASRAEKEIREAREQVEGLRQDLERVSAQASTADEFATEAEGLRKDLEKANEAMCAAQGEVTTSKVARIAAETLLAEADKARGDAEAQLESLRQALADKDAHIQERGVQVSHLERALVTAQEGVTTTARELSDARGDVQMAEARSSDAEQAREEALRQVAQLSSDVRGLEAQLAEAEGSSRQLSTDADQAREDSLRQVAQLSRDVSGLEAQLSEARQLSTDAEQAREDSLRQVMQRSSDVRDLEAQLSESRKVSTDAEQAREEALRQVAQLSSDVGGLEAQVAEATASARRREALVEEQRMALNCSNERAGDLERRLVAVQAEVDGRATAPMSVAEKTSAVPAEAATSPSPPTPTMQWVETRASAANMQCADVLFGEPAADYNPWDAEEGEAVVSTDGAASAKFEQVQAQALVEARHDVQQAEARSSDAEQAREEALRQVAQLSSDVRGLEAQLSEAAGSARQREALVEQQRVACDSSNEKAGDLERRLVALQAELDERASALETVTKELSAAKTAAAAAISSTPNTADNTMTVETASPNAQCADMLFGAPAVNNGVTGSLDASAAPGATTTAEAEQLQAHAEAMELELRYTLESFEGQLSSMAREKLAIRKQVKELTGQRVTLRKQVSHYRKAAKENEAQVEQMLELQQQLCDAEDAAGRLRGVNSDLASKIEALEVGAVNAAQWKQSQDDLLELRARLAEVEEVGEASSKDLSSKAQEVIAAKARIGELEKRIQEADLQLLSLEEVSAATAAELSSSLVKTRQLECSMAKFSELEAASAKLEDEKHILQEALATATGGADEAQQKCNEMEVAICSLQEEKDRALHSLQQADESEARLVAQIAASKKLQDEKNKLQEALATATGGADEAQRKCSEMEVAICSLQEEKDRALNSLQQADETGARLVAQAHIAASVKLEDEKNKLQEALATATGGADEAQQKCSEMEVAICSLQEEKDRALNSLQQADERGARLVAQMAEVASSARTNTQPGPGDMHKGVQTEPEGGRDTEAYKVALQQTRAEGEAARETLRKERLMMMTFRRWGHFYLALSNDALRKRTKERNQARHQRHINEEGPRTMKAPQDYQGRSRRSVSAGRASEQTPVALSCETIQAMLEEEVDNVVRELTHEPSPSLVALSDARKDMDDVAMRAQTTLDMLFAQPAVMPSTMSTEAAPAVGPISVERAVAEAATPEDQDALVAGASPSPMTPPLAAQAPPVAAAVDSSGTAEGIRTPPPVPSSTEEQRDDAPLAAQVPPVAAAVDSSGTAEGTRTPPPVPSSTEEKREDALVTGASPSERRDGLGPVGVVPAPAVAKEAVPSMPMVANRGRTTTGLLVEDGISRAERSEFLRRQREERKANRKKGLHSSAATRSNSSTPAARRASGIGAGSPAASSAPMTPPLAAHVPPVAAAVDNSGSAEGTRTPPPAPSSTEEQRDDTPATNACPPERRDGLQSEGVVPVPAARAPSPLMFNPAAVPPPTAPPTAGAGSQTLVPRHPSVAFSVNETVERAMIQARQDASRAERKATFWKSRFLDVVLWSASFTIMAYASDSGC